MNIIVCIKQVPATTNVQIDPNTGTLIRSGVESIINPFDEYALEEAVKLKEKFGGKVTVLSMGPPQAETALRECIARGADEAILLTDTRFAGADTLATSYTLAKGIEKLSYFDLIICGKQAIDGDTAQVGPGLAEKLGIPHVCYVRKIVEIRDEGDQSLISVERMMEDGYDLLAMFLPALITVVKEINVPRLPSLRGLAKAKSSLMPVWTAKELGVDKNMVGLSGSATRVIKIFFPQRVRRGEILKGELESQVTCLIDKLRETKVI